VEIPGESARRHEPTLAAAAANRKEGTLFRQRGPAVTFPTTGRALVPGTPFALVLISALCDRVAGKPTMALQRIIMTETEREDYRQCLLTLGKRLGGDISGIANEVLRQSGGEASGSLSNAPLHMADLGTDTFEQEMSAGLLENDVQIMEQIHAALERLNQGTYGLCQECRREIPADRLRVLPYTPYCVECARKLQAQKQEGQGPSRL
jgi:DnaK suppressor protein